MAGNGDDYGSPLAERLAAAIAAMKKDIEYLRRDVDAADVRAQRRLDALEERIDTLQEEVDPVVSRFQKTSKDRQQFSGTVLAGSAVAVVSIVLTLVAPIILRLLQGG